MLLVLVSGAQSAKARQISEQQLLLALALLLALLLHLVH
jgi:hypothetical protein